MPIPVMAIAEAAYQALKLANQIAAMMDRAEAKRSGVTQQIAKELAIMQASLDITAEVEAHAETLTDDDLFIGIVDNQNTG